MSGWDRTGRLWPSSLGHIPVELHTNVAHRKPGQALISSRWDSDTLKSIKTLTQHVRKMKSTRTEKELSLDKEEENLNTEGIMIL